METALSKKQGIILRSVRAFCERELAPIAGELDAESRFPWEVADKMGKLGYFGIQAPKELGGAGLDTVSYAVVVEEISKACAALGLCVTVHNSVALYPVLAFGTEDQKRRWIPDLAAGRKIGAFSLTEPNVGSDASKIEARAVKSGDGYVLNANKVFVTNGGIADICLVFAREESAGSPKGPGVFVVERGTPGFTVGTPEDLLGVRANPVCSVRLYDCRVPLANRLGGAGQGLAIGLKALDVGRLGIAAQAVGIAQAALDASLKYAKERHQFGAPIANHQAIQMMLADGATQIEAARLLVFRAASFRDRKRPFSKESAMAKLFASEVAGRVTDAAVQIFGGYGFSKHYPVERFYRDARVTRIYEGTSEVQRMVIARKVLSLQ